MTHNSHQQSAAGPAAPPESGPISGMPPLEAFLRTVVVRVPRHSLGPDSGGAP